MILNDKQIKELAEKEEMISPFVGESISKGISHGLNSFGYDLRCGSEFKIFNDSIRFVTGQTIQKQGCQKRAMYNQSIITFRVYTKRVVIMNSVTIKS